MNKQTPEMKAMFGGKISGGFFDLPLARPGDTQDADMVILGAPAATPYASVGNYCATAPDAIRTAFGWPGVLGHHDFDIDGDLLPEGVRALDWGNLDYSETDFAANRGCWARGGALTRIGTTARFGVVGLVVVITAATSLRRSPTSLILSGRSDTLPESMLATRLSSSLGTELIDDSLGAVRPYWPSDMARSENGGLPVIKSKTTVPKA